MRLFLALDTHELNLDLKKLKVNLNKGKNFEHKWFPENQWHVPVFPLKDMGQERMNHIDQQISTVIQQVEPFSLKLEGVWAYPNQDHGRLLWIGVQNSKELRGLVQKLSEVLGPEDDDEEKPFKPHLPIVRLRNHRAVSDVISPYKNSEFGKVLISNVILYEMTSGGAFPTYRKVRDYPLKELGLTAHP